MASFENVDVITEAGVGPVNEDTPGIEAGAGSSRDELGETDKDADASQPQRIACTAHNLADVTVDAASITSAEPPHHMHRKSSKPSNFRRQNHSAREKPDVVPKWPGWDPKYHKKKHKKRAAKKKKLKQIARGHLSKKDKVRRLSKERPWSVYFMVVGTLLAGLSVAAMVLCGHVHQYISAWTAALVILTGVLGVLHKKNYISKRMNYAYIASALAAYLFVLVGCGLLCHFLVPRMWLMAHALRNETRYQPLLQIISKDLLEWQSSPQNSWLCLGLDLGALLMLILSLVTCTAAILVLHHFWDANHKWTGQFRPYDTPKCLNPMSQVYVAQVVVLMGFVTTSVPVSQSEAAYWSPSWAGLLVMAGSVAGICACKLPDNPRVVLASLGTNLLALLSVVASLGLMTSGLIKDAKIAMRSPEGLEMMRRHGLRVDDPTVQGVHHLYETSLVAFCMATLVLLLAAFFTLGQLARAFHLLFPPSDDDGVLSLHDSNASIVVFFQSTLERIGRRRRQRKERAQETREAREGDDKHQRILPTGRV